MEDIKEIIKSKLADAEFYTFEARNEFELGTEERAKLNEAHKLIVEVIQTMYRN